MKVVDGSIGCGQCVDGCPSGAIQMSRKNGLFGVADINPVLCTGCCVCMDNCPGECIVAVD